MKSLTILIAVIVLCGCGSAANSWGDGNIDGWPDGAETRDGLDDGPCTPGAVRCNGIMRESCSPDGTWEQSPCDAGQVCSGEGNCVAQMCTPGERRCSTADPTVVERCKSDGTMWEYVETCEGNLTCNDGNCIIEVCTPGEIRCSGDQYRVCDPGGTGWSDPADCPPGQACNEGACVPVICTPGVGSCTSASSRLVCNSTGTEEVNEDCLAGYTCLDGVCRLQICPAGMVRCIDDLAYEVCNDSGTDFVTGGSCDSGAGERCIDGACLTACGLVELNPTSIGCIFYGVDLDNYATTGEYGAADASPYAIIVSNIDDVNTASVIVEDRVGGAWRTRASQALGPNSLYTFRLITDQHVEDTNRGNGYAYRVTSDRPVIAYQFNPIDSASQYTNDASLLLPKHTMANLYYVAGWKNLQAATAERSHFNVVGVQDGTSVTVQVSAATVAGGGIPAMSAGGTYTTTLNEADVLQIATSAINLDLTGSMVTSSAPVAVFGGSECADVPQNCSWCRTASGSTLPSTHGSYTCAWCDHVEEQMFPVTTWGMSYIAARVPVRSTGGLVEAGYWRVLASEDNTTVTIATVSGITIRGVTFPYVLNAGQYLEFEMTGPSSTPGDALVTADRPIMLIQYIEGQECTNRGAGDGGDPAEILMVPQEQYLDEYIFITPSTYANNYVVIIKPTTATVTLDGAPVGGTSYPVTAGWEIYRPAVAAGVHHIEGTEPFGIIGVGYSPYVSYGYMGGLALELINPQD
jgi:hypothetical protein